jgi:hypothetical protein
MVMLELKPSDLFFHGKPKLLRRSFSVHCGMAEEEELFKLPDPSEIVSPPDADKSKDPLPP